MTAQDADPRQDRITLSGNRFRHIDMVLIDDFQYFAGRTALQEQLLQTLKALHQAAAGEMVLSEALTPVLAASLRANRATSDRDISQLTPRERDILKLIAQGLPNKMIARRLDITESTVKVHVKHMLKKMKLKSRVEAAVWVHQERIF